MCINVHACTYNISEYMCIHAKYIHVHVHVYSMYSTTVSTCTWVSLSSSLLSESWERWDRMAVHVGLLHTTESPVCTWLGPVNVLNFTARTLVSARRALLRGIGLAWTKET